MEMEELTERLLKAEAALEVQTQQSQALRAVLWKLVELLHMRGTLPLPELVSALRSGEAFAQAAHDRPKSQLLLMEIEMLQAIADALQSRGKH